MADRTFLTLGEGDFSWSADLAVHLAAAINHSSITARLVATGVDSLDDLRKKYMDYDATVKRILRLDSANFHVQVKHEINAIVSEQNNMDNNVEEMKADVVIFNHPHLGTEDAALHGRFLHHLFYSVRRTWMKNHGAFIITLAAGQYERWKCEEAANNHHFRPLAKCRFVPNASVHSMYELRRHQTGKSFRARTSGSFSFVYARVEDNDSSTVNIKDLPWFQNMGDDDTQTTESMRPSIERVQFTCPYCDRRFREERSVKNHISSKHGSTKQRILECRLCKEPQIFYCEEALRDHQQAKHRGPYKTIQPDWVYNSEHEPAITIGQCSVCAIPFTPTYGRIEHMATFLPQPPQTFLCQFCSKKLHSMRAKQQHENFCSSSNAQF